MNSLKFQSPAHIVTADAVLLLMNP